MEAFGETCLFEETSPKVIITATQYQDTNFTEFLFRNFQKVSDLNHNETKSNFTQSEILRFRHEGDCWSGVFSALRSTTAAPIYFNPFHLDYRNPVTNLRKLITFQDGGLVANNPTEIGLSEIFDFWPQQRVDLIVSLGTGRSDKKTPKNSNTSKISNAPDPTTNISHLVKSVINHACDCEKTHKKVMKKINQLKQQSPILFGKTEYLRINIPLNENEYMDLNETDPIKIQALKDLAKQYIKNNPHLLNPLKKNSNLEE